MQHEKGDADGPPLAVTSISSSHGVGATRKVRLSDRDLLERVQQVVVPKAPVALDHLSSKRGWKRIRRGIPKTMHLYSRIIASEQCQVVIGGQVRAPLSELVAFLRAPTESESNALLRAFYGSHFIYSSLLHAIPNTEGRSSIASGAERPLDGHQLMVRTASFAHKGLFHPFQARVASKTCSQSFESRVASQRQASSTVKNEQCCYIELLNATAEACQLSYCSLDTADVLAGKAPSECVIPLHPLTGWFVVAPSPRDPNALDFTFQAAFRGQLPGNCDVKVALNRLICLAKGVGRMDKILRHRQRFQHRNAPKRLWHLLKNPFRVIGDEEAADGRHRNWHCIACTRSFLPTWRKTWRRCDLCAYRVCDEAPCCAHERVAIYNRYVAPLVVCARCRECIDERESENRPQGRESAGDVRYTGVSLHFAERESEMEPEGEPNPSERSRERLLSTGAAERPSRKRRAHSDPPPMLSLALSSSGDACSPNGLL